MMLSKSEAVIAARKLVRTFASAPDPRRQARLVHATLLQWSPWPPDLQQRLDGFGVWMESFPPVGELRGRAADLLERFPDPARSTGPSVRPKR
jgi:hypothetical protein